jgi:L-aspartate oxidase
LKFGIDLTKQPIPVVPAAHYTCGGIYADEWGESSIENLFAIGETACTGLHGANRLASNSLLEGVVFADRAIRRIIEKRNGGQHPLPSRQAMPEPLPEWDSGRAVPMEERININHTWRELRTLMWNYVGIVRTNGRLRKAKERLNLIRHEVKEYYWSYLLTQDLIELRNIVTIADLIIDSALMRKESRGLHYNLDYPHHDDRFSKRDTVL